MPGSVGFFFFNTRALAASLSQGPIPEKITFQYLLANFILWTCTSYYDVLVGARINWTFGLEWIIVLLITCVGLFRVYEVNGGAQGKSFLVRVICLSFPIGLKLGLLSVGLSWALYFILPLIPGWAQPSGVQGLLDLVLFVWIPVFTALFFWRLSVHIDRIRRLQINNILSRDIAE